MIWVIGTIGYFVIAAITVVLLSRFVFNTNAPADYNKMSDADAATTYGLLWPATLLMYAAVSVYAILLQPIYRLFKRLASL